MNRLNPALFASVVLGILIATQPILTTLAIGAAALIFLALFHPITGVIIMLVLAPLRTLLETEAAFRLPLEIGQLTVLLALTLWAIYRIARGQRLISWTWSPVYLPVLVFFSAISFTMFTPISMGAWLSEWLKWAIILVLITFVLNLRHWQWLVFGLVIAGCANALIGLYIFLGGSGALHLLVEDRFFRAFGTFGQPNPFGGFMGLLAPLAYGAALGYLLRLWQHYRRTQTLARHDLMACIFYGLAGAILSVGVIISWSRGAWLGFGVAMMIFVIAIPRRLWQSGVVLSVIAILTLALWTSGRLPASIVDRINSATTELFAFRDVRGIDVTPANYAVIERLAHWQAAVNMAEGNFWLGVGLGNYEFAYGQYRLIVWREPLGHAHNYYLNIFGETGIIGLGAYLTLWIGIVYLTWRARAHPDNLARSVVIGLLGTWVYLATHSLTDNLYVNNLFLHIGVMFGILAVLYRQVWHHTNFR